MNLHNLSDQEFDRALRDHLEDPGIPYDPVSWNKMTKKLDTYYPPDNELKGFLPALALIGLLAVVFFWSLITLSQSSDQLDAIKQVVMNNGQPALVDDKVAPANPKIEQVESETIRKARENEPQQNSVLVNPQEPAGLEESVNTRKESSITAIELLNRTVGKSSVANASIDGYQGNQEPGNKTGSVNQQLYQLTSINASTDSEIENNLMEHIEALELVEDQPPVIMGADSSPWSIGFGYAPDFSLVGSGGATSPGTNLGFAIEYRLGDRWSLQTGLTYSMKRYEAAGEDYNPPPGFWYYGREPDNAEGECDVLDIPLNVRYYFKPQRNHRFFASTGISSYLMLTEEYYYEYDGYQSPDQVDSWSGRNENQHYFGVYNLSVGYQRSFGNRWALEIEPFIKLPLGGVGFGRVNLWSTGSTFSLKYRF